MIVFRHSCSVIPANLSAGVPNSENSDEFSDGGLRTVATI